jgi:hypothetical protein
MAPFDIRIVISISYHIKVSTSLIENIVKVYHFYNWFDFKELRKKF